MKLFKTACFVVAVSVAFAGCSSGTGSDGNGNGGDNEPTQYSFSASPNPSEGGSVNPTSGTFDEGSEVTVEATSNDGWVFSDWSGDISSQENPLTFTINGDTDITANFEEEVPQYSLTISTSPSEAGSVNPSSGTFDEGSEVTVEATANDGFVFSEWTGDQQSTDNPLTFTINEDTDMTANFDDERSMYRVDLMATNLQDTVKDLSIGQAQGAVEGLDSMDEESPPPPPPGALSAFFEINDLDLYKDFRSNIKKQVQWNLQYQVDSGEDFKLDWTIADDTQSPGTLVLTDQSGSFEVDMFNNNTHTVSGSTSGTLIIEYSFN